MNPQYELTFDLQSYWHIGNGKEAGAYADALVLKDNHGLPYLPGKSIKGLLRQAFTTAHLNGWFKDNLTPLLDDKDTDVISFLFGNEERAGTDAQGLVQISSARLPDDESAYLHANHEAKSHLYQVLYATKINHDTGVAAETSLRSMEVAIPLTLTAPLSLNIQHPHYPASNTNMRALFGLCLSQVVTLITELGAKRHRGLGKVIVTATAFGKEQ